MECLLYLPFKVCGDLRAEDIALASGWACILNFLRRLVFFLVHDFCGIALLLRQRLALLQRFVLVDSSAEVPQCSGIFGRLRGRALRYRDAQ
jgi:hypothetical protein